MTVQGVSGATQSYSHQTGVAEELQKQISELQATISELQADQDMEEETKSQQLNVYQAQLSRLQAQLAAAQRAENRSPTDEPRSEEAAEPGEAGPAVSVFGVGQFMDETI